MDLQKIEPLLLDYALGATPPEVAALVEAYLETDTAARSQLAQWQSMVGLARRAIPEQAAAGAIPAFPHRQIQTAHKRARWQKAAAWAATMAACLTLGYFAGNQIRTQPNTSTNIAAGDAQQQASVTVEQPIAAVRNFGSPAWWRAMAQQNAKRPDRPSTYTLKDLAAKYHPTGG